jgi:thioredoxin-like negative regulator of GroEL
MRIREMNDYALMRAITDGGRPVVTAFVERGPDSRPLEDELGSLADSLSEDAVFGVVDASENPTVAGRYGGDDGPSVALFRNGRHVATTHELGGAALADFIERELAT